LLSAAYRNYPGDEQHVIIKRRELARVKAGRSVNPYLRLKVARRIVGESLYGRLVVYPFDYEHPKTPGGSDAKSREAN
jgi:hypothetical protein